MGEYMYLGESILQHHPPHSCVYICAHEHTHAHTRVSAYKHVHELSLGKLVCVGGGGRCFGRKRRNLDQSSYMIHP